MQGYCFIIESDNTKYVLYADKSKNFRALEALLQSTTIDSNEWVWS